jgi:hypothetical protein
VTRNCRGVPTGPEAWSITKLTPMVDFFLFLFFSFRLNLCHPALTLNLDRCVRNGPAPRARGVGGCCGVRAASSDPKEPQRRALSARNRPAKHLRTNRDRDVLIQIMASENLMFNPGFNQRNRFPEKTISWTRSCSEKERPGSNCHDNGCKMLQRRVNICVRISC